MSEINNRWKTKAKKTKTERSKGVAQAIMKVWELNGFVAHLVRFFPINM